MIGKVDRVPLRNVWKNEARDFTVWLGENMDELSEVIGISLSLVETEKSVGPFNVDILAEDEYGNSVVIENQLEKTDHDHLGKVLTYTTNLEAKTAVWISSNPRKEHIEVISWLNEYTPVDFYLIKVEAIVIDSSKPAPLFSVVCEPTAEGKALGSQKVQLSNRHFKRKEFWETLLHKSKGRTSVFSNVSPSISSWISTGVGLTGLALNYTITYEQGGVELYIDSTKDSGELNKSWFDYLHNNKESIESSIGCNLLWERLDDKRASRICKKFTTGLLAEDQHETLQDDMINIMIKFDKEFRKYVPQLRKMK